MLFPWLEPTWQQLIIYKLKNRIPSGIMLCGLAGIGKATFAKVYAQFILCQQMSEHACGQCRSCVLFQAGNHPDFLVVQPQENSATIKIEQIRELVDDLGQTAGLGGYQVALIANAEDMNRSASNALLKTLEEPRGKVLLLLISDRSNAVPATIRSRCQLIHFSLPSAAQARDWLATQLDADQEPAIYLSMSDNLPLKALESAKQEQLKLRDSLLVTLQQIITRKIEPTKAAAEYLSQASEVLFFLITIIMDMIRLKFSVNGYLNHHDKIKELTTLCKTLNAQKLFTFLDIIFEAKQSFTNRSNVNLQLLMDKIFITWRYNHEIS